MPGILTGDFISNEYQEMSVLSAWPTQVLGYCAVNAQLSVWRIFKMWLDGKDQIMSNQRRKKWNDRFRQERQRSRQVHVLSTAQTPFRLLGHLWLSLWESMGVWKSNEQLYTVFGPNYWTSPFIKKGIFNGANPNLTSYWWEGLYFVWWKLIICFI